MRTIQTISGFAGVLASAALVGATLSLACMRSFGGTPADERLERMSRSPMFHGGVFANNPVVPEVKPGTYMTILRRQLFGDELRVPPEGTIPVVQPAPGAFQNPPAPGLRAIWFGHASVLIEIDGVRVFTDPVFSERVSPFTSVGPERFFQPPVALADLPRVDAVVISHDHYDHLDMETVTHLARGGTIFFVPLGIGAHLERWDIKPEQIVELDWWEKRTIGAVEITCAPAVHYSGRGLLNRNSTLWSAWAIKGPRFNFFHSGDSGYSPHFAAIGKRLGPFDLTSIKIGAYDWTWEDIHMNPEQAVRAHVDLGGRRMLPVHWATFNLAIHDWDEPIRRARTAALAAKVEMVTPRPGETVDAKAPFFSSAWWERAGN